MSDLDNPRTAECSKLIQTFQSKKFPAKDQSFRLRPQPRLLRHVLLHLPPPVHPLKKDSLFSNGSNRTTSSLVGSSPPYQRLSYLTLQPKPPFRECGPLFIRCLHLNLMLVYSSSDLNFKTFRKETRRWVSTSVTPFPSMMLCLPPVISDQELCLFILGGLRHACEALMVSITTRVEALTLPDLQGLLFNHELHLQRQQLLDNPPAAHLAQCSQNRPCGDKNNRSSSRGGGHPQGGGRGFAA